MDRNLKYILVFCCFFVVALSMFCSIQFRRIRRASLNGETKPGTMTLYISIMMICLIGMAVMTLYLVLRKQF